MAGDRRPESPGSVSRRRAVTVGAGAALAASGLFVRPAERAGAQAVRTGGGVAGGGQVKEDRKRIHFSVFATRFDGEDDEETVFVGKVQWVDSVANVSVVSKTIEFYGPLEDGGENEREIRGTAIVNSVDTEEIPFVVRLADEDVPGSGNDTIMLYLGEVGSEDPMTDSRYSFGGKLDIGDIQLVSFEIPT